MWNSVDYTGQCKEISFTFTVDQKEKTASGDSEHTFTPGLNVAKLTGTFYQERGAGKIEANMWAAIAAGTLGNLVVKPHNVAVSASNPSYTVSTFIGSFQFINGPVGNEELCVVEFVPAGNVQRSTT
jgi:hypothetical protein